MMKGHKSEVETLQECLEKIKVILKEYNSHIVYDEELNDVIIHDLDTNRFEFGFD